MTWLIFLVPFLLVFLALSVLRGLFKFIFGGFGIVLGIVLILYWYHKDHTVPAPPAGAATVSTPASTQP
jgi:hypothetical protein